MSTFLHAFAVDVAGSDGAIHTILARYDKSDGNHLTVQVDNTSIGSWIALIIGVA